MSKDKAPYKPNMGATVGRDGRRTRTLAIYLHIEPGDASFIANGLYDPDKEQLERVRRAIADDSTSLRAILASPDFVHWFGAMEGDQLKTAPQGYEREHPAIDLLRYKQFLAMHHPSDADVIEGGLLERIVGAYDAMKPFMQWMNEAVGSS